MDIENVVQIDVEPSVDTSGKIAFEIEKTGPQGLSAYDVAVKDGFEGTEQEWLVSLKGDIGETPEIAIGTTQTLPAGSNAVVTKAGTTENPVFSFGIPRGVQGAIGATPNLQVGSVTSGDEPEVTITGTAEEPILNFVLEKGEKGATGSTGEDGFSPIASVTKSAGITTLTITDKTGTTTTTINDGEKGADGQDGAIQYTAGDNITIENNVISATGGDLSNYYTKSETDAKILGANINGLHILNPSNNYMEHTYFIYFEAVGFPTWNTLAPYMKPIMNDYIAHFNTNATYNMITVYIHDPIGNHRMVSRIENWSSSNATPASMMTYDTYTDCYTRSILRFTYTDGVCTNVTGSISVSSTTSGDYPLLKNNTYAFTPTSDYNPATKKYVDDLIGNINTVLATLTTPSNGGE